MGLVRTSLDTFDRTFKPAALWLTGSPFVTVLERRSHLSLIIAVVAWFWQVPGRLAAERTSRISAAWQTISSAQGKPGSGGRDMAIRELTRLEVPLVGINVSGGAYLPGLRLDGADLRAASFANADLTSAFFVKARLDGADLEETRLRGAVFRDAHMSTTNQALISIRSRDPVLDR